MQLILEKQLEVFCDEYDRRNDIIEIERVECIRKLCCVSTKLIQAENGEVWFA